MEMWIVFGFNTTLIFTCHLEAVDLYFDHSLEQRFELTSTGQVCNDISKVTLGSVDECRSAAEELEKVYNYEAYGSHNPKGCFSSYTYVYWIKIRASAFIDITKEMYN